MKGIQINQHGWSKIFNVTATTKDENSPDQQYFVGDFRIKISMQVVVLLAAVSLNCDLFAADRVVVIPLGGTVGNATASDVVKGKTFSSTVVGKGVAGTLEIRDGGTIYTNSIGQKFSLIPDGSFIMGSSAGTLGAIPAWPVENGRSTNEKQHLVTLTKDFYMQTTEVTQGQWEQVMGSGTNPSFFTSCGMDCPVELVSWNDAQNFIDALNAREGRGNCNTTPNTCYSLPTEAQWEYAVRAGTLSAFYSGALTAGENCGSDPNLDKIGWYCVNANSTTHPVAQKAPNNWGLYDMSGNVKEWCQDRFDLYPDGPVDDPTGAVSGSNHVARGGSWFAWVRFNRSAYRFQHPPDDTSSDLGFRLVLPPAQ